MRSALTAHLAVLTKGKGRFVTRLFLEYFVILVVLSDVPKRLTIATL